MSCGVRILHEWRLANYWVRIEEWEPGIVRFTQARSECSLPPDSSEFFPTEKPMGTANEIIHLAKALEQQREATKEAWRVAALRAWYDCIDCGSHIKVDEDGCCATCGRDADLIDLDYVQRRITSLERDNEESADEIRQLREAVRMTYCKNTSGWICRKDKDGLPSNVALFLHETNPLPAIDRALEEVQK